MNTLITTPPVIEWRVYRNDTTKLTLVVNDIKDKALDITDWEFTGQVRSMPRSTDVITTLSISKNENILSVTLDTSDLDQVNYFDIQGINTETNAVSTIITGTIYVDEDVTR